MMALKAINTSFAPIKHTLFHTRKSFHQKNSMICLSKSSDSNPDSESEASPPPQGDISKQELLARIAMLQTSKVRLTDYIDERSAYLTQFGEEANAEVDKIGEDALKGLDEAGARILGNMDSQMQAFEESAQLNRQEIEDNENKLAEFEGQMVKDMNEGMFFKNLGQKPPVDKAKAKADADRIKELTKAKAGSKVRKNIYLALIAVLALVIADSFILSTPDWRKVAVLGAILVGLITQLSYEQRLSSEIESIEKTDKEKK